MSRLLENSIQYFPEKEDLFVLDVGCGSKPYLPLFQQISSLYVGIDLEKCAAKNVDVVSSAEKIPFGDSLFNLVLCIQVLEHLDSPSEVISEIHRVLRTDGILLLSTHGVWPVHGAPNDFWRWTNFGLEKILSGFSAVRIFECGGSISSLFQIMNLYLPDIHIIRPLGSLFLNKMAPRLDSKFKGPRLAVNYLAVAKK